MKTKYFFMGYDFFSKLHDGHIKRKEYEDAIKRAMDKQNRAKDQNYKFIQKKLTYLDKLEEKPIFKEVMSIIGECDTAILDLTSRVSIYEYNLNVIFELGAALFGHLSKKGVPRYVAYFYHNQTNNKNSDEVAEHIAKDISDLSLVSTSKKFPIKCAGFLYVYKNYDELTERLAEVLIQKGMKEGD
ncbi:MAG: hypothetical protein ABIF11_05870 [Nitrospirota bacterium]